MVQRRASGLVRRFGPRENISRVSPTGFPDRHRNQVDTSLRKRNNHDFQMTTGIDTEDI
ncbi:MAG: hypothetical protein ACYC2T_09220 [Bacillota bacterium]